MVATAMADLPHPITGQSVGYANAPTDFFAYRDHVFVAFSHPSFSGVHAYDVRGTNVSRTRVVYFETVSTNVEGITTTTYFSDTSNALLVQGREAWFFDVEYIVVVDVDNAFFNNNLPNASYELISFDHGQIHTVAYDLRNEKVYIMLGSRLFAIDAATREVLPTTSSAARPRLSTTGRSLRGPLIVDATHG